MHVIAPAHIVIPQQVPPQPQRQRIPRDEQIADFRKFKQHMILAPQKSQQQHHAPVQQQTGPPPSQQMPIQQQQKQVKNIKPII